MEVSNMKKNTYKLGCARPVCQFDMDMHFIKEWKSATSTKIYHVNEVCNGLRKSIGGYLWKWKDECSLKDLSNGDK